MFLILMNKVFKQVYQKHQTTINIYIFLVEDNQRNTDFIKAQLNRIVFIIILPFKFFFLSNIQLNMQSFQLTSNYLESPRKGEILGPLKSSNFVALSHTQYSSIKVQKLASTKKALEAEISEAEQQLTKMLELFDKMQKTEEGKVVQLKKYKRRTTEEFAVHFFCPYKGCNKFYGVQSALNRHIKLKHYCLKSTPPDYYHQLHPQPDLAELLYQQSSQNHFQNDLQTQNKALKRRIEDNSQNQ